jgi:hypothetical protein
MLRGNEEHLNVHGWGTARRSADETIPADANLDV